MAGMYEHTIDRISSGYKIYVFRLGILLSAYTFACVSSHIM